MSNGKFYSAGEMSSGDYEELIPVYQAAFAANPWNEVSKCVGENKSILCVDGLSALAVGQFCEDCTASPGLPAYEPQQLRDKFLELEDRGSVWYVEKGDKGVTLGAVAWKATPSEIAKAKYSGDEEMKEWLQRRFSTIPQRIKRSLNLQVKEPEIVWLDEVFSNREIKPSGNLKNFGKFVVGMAKILDSELVAYRTIEPRMLSVATRDFGNYRSRIDKRGVDVPDRRDFVVLDTTMDEAVSALGAEVPITAYSRVRRQI